MYFTLSEAALKVGMSRSSIYRLIEEGKLSATTDHRGKKVVELTELLRVFGSIKDETEQNMSQEDRKHKPVNVSGTASKTGQDTLVSAVQELERMRYQLQLKDMELKLKDKELELVQERLGDLKQVAEQVNQEKNKLLEIIERQSLMLAAPKPQKAPSQARSKAVKPATTPAKANTPLKTASKPLAKSVPVKAKPVNTKKALTTQAKTKVSTPAKAVSKRPASKVATKSGPKLSAKSKPTTKPKR